MAKWSKISHPLGDLGIDSGDEDKIGAGGKNYDEPKYFSFLSYFGSSQFFSARFEFVLVPTICPWVSQDENGRLFGCELQSMKVHKENTQST